MNGDGAFDRALYNDAYPPGIERHYWNLARQRIVGDAVQRLATPGAVLDVGCGPGHQVAHLRALGIDCHGCDAGIADPVPGAAAHCRYGTPVEALPAAWRDTTTCALLLDVIEHLDQPGLLLAEIGRALPRLAHLVVTVPAGPALWSNYDEHFGHHRRYTAELLRHELVQAGWRIDRLQPLFAPLYAPARLGAALGLKRAVRLRAPGASAPLHRLLAALLVHTAGWGPGTSLLAVASRAG